MYVTRPRSFYKRNPSALSVSHPEGPELGYLVLQDEEAQATSCFGLCENSKISHMPLPQNKDLKLSYSQGDASGNYHDEVTFIPVLNHPLSSNRYYVIYRTGKHQGKACTSSKEEDMGSFLCCSYVKDVKPRPLDPFNEYQQFRIIKTPYGFYAESAAPDGFAPKFLGELVWSLSATDPCHYHLDEAPGLNYSLREQLPALNFPLSNDHSEPFVIGKWYCPFMFVKEGVKLWVQMKRSIFYELTLVKRWDKIFSKKNGSVGDEGKVVLVDVVVETEFAMVAAKKAVLDEGNAADGVLWFKNLDSVGREVSVGLSLAIVGRMKWEQERGGWMGGNERQVRVTREEKFEGIGRWEDFGCYVLVESFLLKRMDGRLVLTYDFRHTHQIICKWE